MPRHVDYEPGKPVTVRTGESVVIRVPGASATVAIHAPMAAGPRSEYPACTLESTDGTYRSRLTAKDDLVPGDDWLQLRFHGIPKGKRFTLRFEPAPDIAQVLMEDVPYESIVDGEHALRVPVEADRSFRSKPITCSGPCRSPIPEQADR